MSVEELTRNDLTRLTARDAGVLNGLDPRLQRMLVCRKYGLRTQVRASAAADEVIVTARVKDSKAWEAQSEVRPGVSIPGRSENGRQDAIVTGRIPVSRIEAIRNLPFVLSLKASRPLRRTLAATIQESQAAPLPAGSLANGGKGAVVGIVDFGCDFAHRNFRHADGSTRLLGIWDQAAMRRASDPVDYGRFYSAAEINAALSKTDPYEALGYPVPVDSGEEQGTHGTHVMDIAAGNGLGSGVAGVAPQADLLFVEAGTVLKMGPDAVGSSFGDSVRLLEALEFIFRTAGVRPCSINISLGTNGGPHDGTTLVEQGIDRLLSQQPNRCVSIAASNSFADGIHAAGTVAEGGSFDLQWELQEGDESDNELEIWYPLSDLLAVELLSPDGHSLLRVEPGQTRQLTAGPGQGPVVLVANRLHDPNNLDNTIGVFLDKRLPSGVWTVRLHGLTVVDGTFDAWIERDDAGQSNFVEAQQDASRTLGSISCGRKTLVVASFDAHKAALPVSWFSSAGPTRDGRSKPEISAGGHDVLAAHSRTGTGVVAKSGTSMAAPAVTGAIALLLAEAAARGRSLDIDEIRELAIQAARRDPPSGSAWDSRLGNGRLFVPAMLAPLLAAAPGAAVTDPLGGGDNQEKPK